MDCISPVEFQDKEWWDVVECPSTMEDQYFGFELSGEDFQSTDEFFKECTGFSKKHTKFQFLPSEGKVLSVDTGYSKVISDDKEFEINLTIKPFKVDDIKVSFTKGFLVIHCQHSTVTEDNGEVSRSFERNYVLPRNCDQNTLTSYVRSDDVLVVKCQKIGERPVLDITVGCSAS